MIPSRNFSRRTHYATLGAAVLLLCGCKKETSGPAAGTASSPVTLTQTPDLAKSLDTLLPGAMRMVWVQSTKPGCDPFATGSDLLLVGYDVGDGIGIRAILPEKRSVFRPLFMPDGRSVVFTDRSGAEPRIQSVEWDTGKLTDLGPGVALSTWRHMTDLSDWIYAVEKTQPSARGGLIGELMVRFRPETPGEKEIIPVGTPIEAQSFQLSADGLRATALVPAPLAARLNLKEYTSESLMDGTWPIMAPDNSYLTAVLDTPKGTLQFYTPNQREPVALNLSSLGGLAGGYAWQPRWANRGGFLAFSGPYEKPPDDPSFDPASMGSKSEIFLGRLGAGATELQGVVQITQNDRADFFPDVYIFGPPVPLAGFEQAPPDRSMDQPIPWPQTTEALHFAWNELGVDTKLPTADGAKRICRVEARKFARFNRLLSMELNGGQFVADSESSSAIASACQTSHEFTFEALIMEGVEGYDPISLKLADITGADGAEYFGLYRLDHRLVARLLLGKDGEPSLNYPYKLLDFRIEFGRPYHLVVTLKGKSLRCYVDGQLASEVFVEREGLAGWKSGGSLTFGDAQPFDGGRWLGSMEQVACYARELTDREVARHFEAAKQKISKLKPVDRVTVVGKLLEITPLSADPASPYPRMLLASRYEIESVARGVFQPKEITLLHWGMLDRKEVPNRPVKVGQRYSLAVEPISLHPELKSERIENTTSDTTSPLYYEISTPGKNLEAE